jgi:hypothetical protein
MGFATTLGMLHRFLLPQEVGRLHGLPEELLREGGPLHVCAATQHAAAVDARKQQARTLWSLLGNSLSVDVAAWLLARLMLTL